MSKNLRNWVTPEQGARLARVAPVLANLPQNVLGSKRPMLSALYSIGIKGIFKIAAVALPLRAELQSELGTDKSLRGIFADPDLKNKAVQSNTMQQMLASPQLWEGVDKCTGGSPKVLGTDYYEALDQKITWWANTPSKTPLTTTSKMKLAADLATPVAIHSLTNLASSGKKPLDAFLKASKAVHELPFATKAALYFGPTALRSTSWVIPKVKTGHTKKGLGI